MPSPVFPRYRAALLLAAAALAGPVACGPEVSRFDLDSAQSRLDGAKARQMALEQEQKALLEELQKLKTFGGADHVKKVQTAGALRTEKTTLEGHLKDLQGRLDHFTKETARQHEMLAKDKK